MLHSLSLNVNPRILGHPFALLTDTGVTLREALSYTNNPRVLGEAFLQRRRLVRMRDSRHNSHLCRYDGIRETHVVRHSELGFAEFNGYQRLGVIPSNSSVHISVHIDGRHTLTGSP